MSSESSLCPSPHITQIEGENRTTPRMRSQHWATPCACLIFFLELLLCPFCCSCYCYCQEYFGKEQGGERKRGATGRKGAKKILRRTNCEGREI